VRKRSEPPRARPSGRCLGLRLQPAIQHKHHRHGRGEHGKSFQHHWSNPDIPNRSPQRKRRRDEFALPGDFATVARSDRGGRLGRPWPRPRSHRNARGRLFWLGFHPMWRYLIRYLAGSLPWFMAEKCII
jgi:hypothetical protein